MVSFVRKAGKQVMAILKPDNLSQSFGIIFLLLASIGVISFTSKFIFGYGRIQGINPIDQIYDPDHGRNITKICPFTTNTYQIQYNQTVCFNKTMHYRYLPWLHFDVWRHFNESNREKKMRRLRQLERITEAENEGNNDTMTENVAEETVESTESPANRKVKDEPSKVVCTILAALLVVSSAVAFFEVFRDKCMSKAKPSPRASKQFISFADPLSKEQIPEERRQEPFQSSAKVTQTLVQQTSLDRAFSRLSSEGVKPLFRRSSVPTQVMSSTDGGGTNEVTSFFHGHPLGHGQQMNQSLSDNPETRRKSRHFIRRH